MLYLIIVRMISLNVILTVSIIIILVLLICFRDNLFTFFPFTKLAGTNIERIYTQCLNSLETSNEYNVDYKDLKKDNVNTRKDK